MSNKKQPGQDLVRGYRPGELKEGYQPKQDNGAVDLSHLKLPQGSAVVRPGSAPKPDRAAR